MFTIATTILHAPLITCASATRDIIVISEFTPAWGRELEFLNKSYPHRLADARSDPWGSRYSRVCPFAEAELIDLAQTGTVHVRFCCRGGIDAVGGICHPLISADIA